MTEALQAILSAYQLGELIPDSFEQIPSYTHEIQVLETNLGKYVIKKLNATFAKSAQYRQRIQASIALDEVLDAANIGINHVIKQGGNALYQYGEASYVVSSWVEGVTLTDQQITWDHTATTAKLLSKIQAIELSPLADLAYLNYTPNREHWQALAERCVGEPAVKQSIESCWSTIDFLHSTVPDFHQQLQPSRVLCHGDVDPCNLLWRGTDHVILIDWEWAGLAPRYQDCWAAALSCSRDGFCQWDRRRLQGFWQSYQQQSDFSRHDCQLELAYYTLCAYWFEWVDWSLQRLLAKPSITGQEKAFVIKTITDTLATLHYLVEHKPAIFQLLD